MGLCVGTGCALFRSGGGGGGGGSAAQTSDGLEILDLQESEKVIKGQTPWETNMLFKHKVVLI